MIARPSTAAAPAAAGAAPPRPFPPARDGCRHPAAGPRVAGILAGRLLVLLLAATAAITAITASGSAAEKEAAAWRLADPGPASATGADPTIIVRTVARADRTAEERPAVAIRAAVFSAATHALKVIDDPTGDLSLAAAMRENGCLAGVNGGYFHPDRTPLGLVVAGGKIVHGYEKARLLSGLVVVTEAGSRLLRVREHKADTDYLEALQAGPFLVDDGVAVAGLEATRRAERTAVLWDGKKRLALVATGGLTLAEAAELFAVPELVADFKVRRALNLDGGSSTAFWARKPDIYLPPWKPVRNYLGIVPR